MGEASLDNLVHQESYPKEQRKHWAYIGKGDVYHPYGYMLEKPERIQLSHNYSIGVRSLGMGLPAWA